MKKIENLLLLAVVAVLCWPLTGGGHTYDLHLHDTYFVIAFPGFFLAGLLLVLFLFYKILRWRHRSVNELMTVTHVFITILFIASVLYAFAPVKTASRPRSYLDYSNWQEIETQNGGRNLIIALIIIVFLITQFVFFLYFIIRLVQQPNLPGSNRQIDQ